MQALSRVVFRLVGALRPVYGGGSLLNVKSQVNKNQTEVFVIFLFEIFCLVLNSALAPKYKTFRNALCSLNVK